MTCMDSLERFGEEHLADKEHFYRQLYEAGIIDKEYARNTTWKRVNILFCI